MKFFSWLSECARNHPKNKSTLSNWVEKDSALTNTNLRRLHKPNFLLSHNRHLRLYVIYPDNRNSISSKFHFSNDRDFACPCNCALVEQSIHFVRLVLDFQNWKILSNFFLMSAATSTWKDQRAERDSRIKWNCLASKEFVGKFLNVVHMLHDPTWQLSSPI